MSTTLQPLRLRILAYIIGVNRPALPTRTTGYKPHFRTLAGGPSFLNDFFGAFQQGFTFTSEIHNVEFNIRRQLTNPIWFLVGLRYVDYDESIEFYSVDAPFAGSEIGRYNVSADNQMLGLQLGGDANYQLREWLAMTAKFKVGMFINWVDHDTTLLNNNPDILFQGGKSDTGLSGLIDASLMFRANRGNVELLAGYRVLLFSPT